jgi:hypothetical protein
MNETHEKFPQSLTGLFELDINRLTLRTLKLSDTKPNEHRLKEIRFENGIGKAEFDNGFVASLNVKYDEISNSYTFPFGDADHIFEIKASFAGICNTVDIMSLIDFSKLSKEDQQL